MKKVLEDVVDERAQQDEKWGVQAHPDGTGGELADRQCAEAKSWTEVQARRGKVTWRDILDEEVKEAFSESDRRRLREELVQVAAVAVAWIEDIDRRGERP